MARCAWADGVATDVVADHLVEDVELALCEAIDLDEQPSVVGLGVRLVVEELTLVEVGLEEVVVVVV